MAESLNCLKMAACCGSLRVSARNLLRCPRVSSAKKLARSEPASPIITLAFRPTICSISRCVKFWTASKRHRAFGKLAATGAMLFLWLATFALAASPQLHQLLHQDAQSLNHHCLITQIKQHSLLSSAPTALAPIPPPVGLGSVCCPDSQFLPTFDYCLFFSRGPPSIFSSNPVVR